MFYIHFFFSYCILFSLVINHQNWIMIYCRLTWSSLHSSVAVKVCVKFVRFWAKRAKISRSLPRLRIIRESRSMYTLNYLSALLKIFKKFWCSMKKKAWVANCSSNYNLGRGMFGLLRKWNCPLEWFLKINILFVVFF